MNGRSAPHSYPPWMSLNSNLEPHHARRESNQRERQRQEARALREQGRYPHTAAVATQPPSPAMFTLVKRRQDSDGQNPITKVLGSFDSFSKIGEGIDLMGVDQQPGTPAPATNHHDAHYQRPQPGHNRRFAGQQHTTSRAHSSSSRPPTSKSEAKPPPQTQPSRPSSNNECKPAAPVSKQLSVTNDRKLAMIFEEMADLRAPMSALRETPRHDDQPVFQFPTPPKKDAKQGKTPVKHQVSAPPLESFLSDLSDDSDQETASSTVNGNVTHSNGKIRQASTTSQNSDDSSNSEDSSCSDSEDSSSNSSADEEDKVSQPETSQLPPSPASTDPIAMSWSLEKLFNQQNGTAAKEEVFREQEIPIKAYDAQYDSLSRSPHRTDLAPPIITKEPMGRTRRLTEDSSDESAFDSSFTKRRESQRMSQKFIDRMRNSPLLSVSDSEQLDPVPDTNKNPINVPSKVKESPHKDRLTRNSKSSLPSIACPSLKPSRERSNRKSRSSTKDKVSKMNIKSMEIIPSDLESDSDDEKGSVKLSQTEKISKSSNLSRKSSRKVIEDGNRVEKLVRNSKSLENSPPTQEPKYLKPEINPPILEERHTPRSSENIVKESLSKSHSKRGRNHQVDKATNERISRKPIPEERLKPSKRSVSPPYNYSINQGLAVPKLDVSPGVSPSAVLLIPVDLVRKVPADKQSTAKLKVTKEVIEMRTSPSNEDAKKLRAICSIYIKGSKKRPSSQESDRNRKSPKVEDSQPIANKPNIEKDNVSSRNSTPRPQSTTPKQRSSTPIPEAAPRHSSSRNKAAKEVVSKNKEKAKDKEKYPQTKEERKRRRKASDDEQQPKKRNKSETVTATSQDLLEHKTLSEKKETYRSYVKDSSSPGQRSSRTKDSSRSSSSNASHNVDIQEFASSDRNSDDESCFRTPQQVQSYGYKETNSKRQKVEGNQDGRQASKKVLPPANTTSSDILKSASSNQLTQVPPNHSYFSYLERRRPIVASDHMQYLMKAKELKHLADKETNRILQVMIYLESGLYFILTGESMEQESTNIGAAFSMYNDTLKFIRHVSSIIVRKDSFKDDPSHNNLNSKLAVLSLRCQSLLYLKLYTMHAGEATEVQRELAEYFKLASKSPTVPIAWNSGGQVMATGGATSTTTIGGRMANSPSSLSPTPSPAGSEGSQSSSGYGTEGASQRAVAGVMSATPPMLQTSSGHLVSKHMFVSFQRHLSISNFLVAAHHHWVESDTYIYEYDTKDFFIAMDHELGPLTLHSTPSELVIYVQKSLDKLKA